MRGIETGSCMYVYLSVYSRKGPSVIELLKNPKQKPQNSAVVVVVVLHTRCNLCFLFLLLYFSCYDYDYYLHIFCLLLRYMFKL